MNLEKLAVLMIAGATVLLALYGFLLWWLRKK